MEIVRRRQPESKTTETAKTVRRSIESDEPDEDPNEDMSKLLAVSTGSTLLNLALTDDPKRGYLAGKYFFIVGDSSSGKTFLSMTCFAEAAINPHFDNYDFIYDNVEDGMLIDVDRFFGKRVAKRLKAPKYDKERAVFSETIEEFYINIDALVEKRKPFIYVLDSMDGLSSLDEDKNFEKLQKAAEGDTKVKGSYGDGKAKKNAAGLRRVISGLRATGSILIIICQTRDNIEAFSFEKKTRSGGRALRFYATTEYWSSIKGPIKMTKRGVERKIGHTILLQLKKNRVTGKLHQVEVPIYPSYGIDDIGSMIDFLVEDGWWKKGKGRKRGEAAPEGEEGSGIAAGELLGDGLSGSRESLIALCDESNKNRETLIKTVKKAWDRIQEENAVKRTPRYS